MDLLRAVRVVIAMILLSTSLVECQVRRARNPNVASLLKNIMTPSSSNGALQLLKMASRNRASPVLTEEVVLSNRVAPRSVLPNGLLQKRVLTQGQTKFVGAPQFEVARQVPIEYPVQFEVARPVSNLQVVEYSPQIEVARAVSNLPVMEYSPQIEVVRQVPKPVPVVEKPCPAPAPLVNPFLPAASPVSALAPPTSNLLPPANINSPRCTYLRKIPIPPPSL